MSFEKVLTSHTLHYTVEMRCNIARGREYSFSRDLADTWIHGELEERGRGGGADARGGSTDGGSAGRRNYCAACHVRLLSALYAREEELDRATRTYMHETMPRSKLRSRTTRADRKITFPLNIVDRCR